MTSPDTFLLAGVMGWPIMHSRSPLMHNHWIEQLGLAGRYVPLAVRPEGLEAALRALPALGFVGCNLTMPLKQLALRIVDEVQASAQSIGAISCVTVGEGGRLVGSNNDAAGFIRNLRAQQPQWRAEAGPVVVIGAGGGSRAVCYGLLGEGVREIRLVNRTLARAQEVAQALGSVQAANAGASGAGASGRITALPWSQRHEALAGAALVVNTSSLGMAGQGTLDLSLEALPAQAIAADIVYIPLETPFLAAARARGNAVVDGLGMLLHQGPLAWKAWIGVEPEVSGELRRLVQASLQT